MKVRHVIANESNEDIIAEKVMDIIKAREQSKRESDYQQWCDRFANLPANSGRTLKDGFIAGVELQPSRWIQHGLDLIGSRKAFGTIQLMDGNTGPDLRSFLPYAVFQMGAEIFLKGMWLYKHQECREVHASAYVAPDRRDFFLREMKNISRTHDLLEIIGHVEPIEVYSKDDQIRRFLKIVAGISKEYYLPVTQGKSPWADERYPKRFYDDSSKVGGADAVQTYPEHWPIARLFAETSDRIEFVWRNESSD
ncbi:MAG TPA: hypothetical protein VGR14_02620 [Verrucomicrobiae bacterium]|nr:hypothetical protein [Verrucomicrobiae bacterium]